MPSARLPRNVFFVVVLVALARCSYFYPLLPARVASHFDISGVPNGWMTKPLFFELYAAGVALGIVVVFLPALTIAKLPALSSICRTRSTGSPPSTAPRQTHCSRAALHGSAAHFSPLRLWCSISQCKRISFHHPAFLLSLCSSAWRCFSFGRAGGPSISSAISPFPNLQSSHFPPEEFGSDLPSQHDSSRARSGASKFVAGLARKFYISI